MRVALELRGITKRFVAGAGTCTASAEALRGFDLIVYEGEAVSIVGGIATGKSTALLCAAGLLAPDAGVVRWFGIEARAASVERTTYHFADTRRDVTRLPRRDLPHVHLIDGPERLPDESIERLTRWIVRHRSRGDSIIVATRDRWLADRLTDRSVTLVGGRAYLGIPTRAARVAEGVARLVSGGGTM